MRKLGIGMFGLFAALSILSLSVYKLDPKLSDEIPNQPTPEVLGVPTETIRVEFIEIDSPQPLKAAISEPLSGESLQLFSNLENTQTSVEIMTKESCQLLVNGSFYTTENTHGGLFIEESELTQPFVTNQTYNGIFSINALDTPRITRTLPNDPIRLAVQTGPLLIENSFPEIVEISNDKPARRMIAAVTGDNEIIFISLYNSQSAFLGPYLSDVPAILEQLNNDLELGIADAINLDGGSASVFATKEFTLPEASTIGSYFCVTNERQ